MGATKLEARQSSWRIPVRIYSRHGAQTTRSGHVRIYARHGAQTTRSGQPFQRERIVKNGKLAEPAVLGFGRIFDERRVELGIGRRLQQGEKFANDRTKIGEGVGRRAGERRRPTVLGLVIQKEESRHVDRRRGNHRGQ